MENLEEDYEDFDMGYGNNSDDDTTDTDTSSSDEEGAATSSSDDDSGSESEDFLAAYGKKKKVPKVKSQAQIMRAIKMKNKRCFFVRIDTPKTNKPYARVIKARKYKQAASKVANIYRKRLAGIKPPKRPKKGQRKAERSPRPTLPPLKVRVSVVRLTKNLVKYLVANSILTTSNFLERIEKLKKTDETMPPAERYIYEVSIEDDESPHIFKARNSSGEKITVNILTKVNVRLISPMKAHFQNTRERLCEGKKEAASARRRRSARLSAQQKN